MSYTEFLIEYENGKWLTEEGKLTNNPLEAKMYDNEAKALWAMFNVWKISLKEGYRVTEHEFVIT